MRTLRPDLPPGWQAALAAETLASVDSKAASAQWRTALAAAPDDPEVLSGYANFLTDQGREPADAEHLLRLALRQKPAESAYAANLARLLLAEGRHPEGLEQLASALSVAMAEREPDTQVLAELMFYLLAHDRSRWSLALATLKRLIRSGARTPGWSFDPNIHRAQDEGHPELALLRDLAKVLSHGANAALLDSHVAWRAV